MLSDLTFPLNAVIFLQIYRSLQLQFISLYRSIVVDISGSATLDGKKCV